MDDFNFIFNMFEVLILIIALTIIGSKIFKYFKNNKSSK